MIPNYRDFTMGSIFSAINQPLTRSALLTANCRGCEGGPCYGEELVCKVASEHFDCYLEADGGKFRLTPEGDGLRLEVTAGGGGTDQIVAEGTDWGTFGGPGSDDRVFILRRADRKHCDAAIAN